MNGVLHSMFDNKRHKYSIVTWYQHLAESVQQSSYLEGENKHNEPVVLQYKKHADTSHYR